MSPTLAVTVLLIGHLCSFSASFLEKMKLGSEELSPTRSLTAPPIGSPVTSLNLPYAHLLSGNLDGYLVLAQYSDSLCKIPTTVTYTLLNNCRLTSFYIYELYMATSSRYVIGKFINDCTLPTDGTNPFTSGGEITNGSCRGPYNSYVISTPPLATEGGIPFIR